VYYAHTVHTQLDKTNLDTKAYEALSESSISSLSSDRMHICPSELLTSFRLSFLLPLHGRRGRDRVEVTDGFKRYQSTRQEMRMVGRIEGRMDGWMDEGREGGREE
jgi:hypothetical protein